ncbi:MAG: hypothetical protein IPG75_15290 [Gemmatimonadetes bacterium]|nr:hypothetical protein [Gemmatimonadota bacterium]
MNRLTVVLLERIREHVQASVGGLQGDDPELRTVFHGPPLEMLRPTFSALREEGGVEARLSSGRTVHVPVLLQVDHLRAGQTNPAIGASGECDGGHLLALRNSPACPRFVVLVPPGQQNELSVASASDEFGLSAANNSGTATVDEWWRDDFIQALIDAAVSRHEWPSEREREQARRLAEYAVKAADEADRHAVARYQAWCVLARLLSISDARIPFGTSWSLACGVPPTDDGTIRWEEHKDVLDELAERLSDHGFKPGIERLKGSRRRGQTCT